MGKVWGHTNVLENIQHFMCAQGMLSVPIFKNPGMGVQIFAAKKGEAIEDKEGIAAAKMLGERVAELVGVINMKTQKQG